MRRMGNIRKTNVLVRHPLTRNVGNLDSSRILSKGQPAGFLREGPKTGLVLLHGLNKALQLVPVRREEGTGRVGGGIAGEESRLTATPAKIGFAPRACGAGGLAYRLRAAKTVERIGVVPNPAQRARAHIVKMQALNGRSGWAGQDFAGGIDCQESRNPSHSCTVSGGRRNNRA